MLGFRFTHVLATASMLAVASLAPACGSDEDGRVECCAAECVSMLGSFTFLSGGARTTVSGTATITEVASGTVLAQLDMMSWPTLEVSVDDATLAPYEGQTIEVEVAVDAVGFSPFAQRYMLSVQREEVCCSSCISARGSFDIELGTASPIFLDGCNPGGGDPACPLTLPTTTDSCSAQLCCNYDAGNDEVIGCICNGNGTGWTCAASACACTGG